MVFLLTTAVRHFDFCVEYGLSNSTENDVMMKKKWVGTMKYILCLGTMEFSNLIIVYLIQWIQLVFFRSRGGGCIFMKKQLFMVFVFVLIISVGMVGCQSAKTETTEDHSTVEKAIEKGKLALADGDYQKAKNNFDLALAEDKNSKEAKEWLALVKKIELLSLHLENKEINNAIKVIADIKGDKLYKAIRSQMEDFESKLATLKSSIEKIDNEIVALNQKLKEAAFDEVIAKGNALKSEPNITEEQLATIDSIIIEASTKKKNSIQYNTYTNTRYGFSIEYPTTFNMSPPPTNNDGREFTNGEATITAFGSHINVIEDNETIETYYDRELESISSPISYQRLGNDWYVLSYQEGNNTVYQKAIIGETIISTLIIRYPSSRQEYYGPMITRISDTFKGGQTEL